MFPELGEVRSHQCAHHGAWTSMDPIIDLAQRLSRELNEENDKLQKEREALQKALEDERRNLKEQLEERDQRIQEERDGLGYDQERVQIITGQIDDEVISLNVGGEFFFTQRSTLCACEDSYLANLFSGRWESSIERDSFGRFFLDFDPFCFRLLLNFLRSKRQSRTPLPAPKVPPEKEEQFWHLVEYFGLTEQLQVVDAPEPEAKPSTQSLFGAGPAGLLQSALGVFRQSTETQSTRDSEAPRMAPSAPRMQSAPRHDISASSARYPVLATGPPPSASASSVEAPEISSSAPDRLPDYVPDPSEPEAPNDLASSSKRPGWSKRVAHRLASIAADASTVRLNDSRSLAAAAAVRASRGFRAGRHAWEVKVLLCSDWSYVGFVGEGWTALTLPIGRAPQSWGIASNGVVYAEGEELVTVKDYGVNSCLRFVVDMDCGLTSVVIDGHEFQVFKHLPTTVFPAVSNCRSPAEYHINFIGELAKTKRASRLPKLFNV